MMVGSVEGGYLALGVFKKWEDLSSALHPFRNITRRMGLVSTKHLFVFLMCFGAFIHTCRADGVGSTISGLLSIGNRRRVDTSNLVKEHRESSICRIKGLGLGNVCASKSKSHFHWSKMMPGRAI